MNDRTTNRTCSTHTNSKTKLGSRSVRDLWTQSSYTGSFNKDREEIYITNRIIHKEMERFLISEQEGGKRMGQTSLEGVLKSLITVLQGGKSV